MTQKGKVSTPTREDLQNRPVPIWRRELSNRYSRMTATVDGYRFVYDNKDKCWRPLKARRITKADEAAARAQRDKTQLTAKARRERRRAFVRKHLNIMQINTRPLSLGFGWIESAMGLIVTIIVLAANAILLPAFPILAVVLGGLVMWLFGAVIVGFVQIIWQGRVPDAAIGKLFLLALIGLLPLAGFLTLHVLIGRFWHGA